MQNATVSMSLSKNSPADSRAPVLSPMTHQLQEQTVSAVVTVDPQALVESLVDDVLDELDEMGISLGEASSDELFETRYSALDDLLHTDRDPFGNDRAEVEMNTIAMTAHARRTTPTLHDADWLGRHSPRLDISQTGLWNVEHVHALFGIGVLSALEEFVEKTQPIDDD